MLSDHRKYHFIHSFIHLTAIKQLLYPRQDPEVTNRWLNSHQGS